jgi:hypothetical protein
LLTSFLTAGITARDVGKATITPIAKPNAQALRKLGLNPKFMIAIASDIVNDMAIDMNSARSTEEYFLLIFKVIVISWKSGKSNAYSLLLQASCSAI